MFIAYLLSRNIRIEEDLVDRSFNSSEKLLAGLLLMLANYGKDLKPETVCPKDEPGDSRRNGRYYSVASQLLHDQVQEDGFHSLQWQSARAQCAAHGGPSRLSFCLCEPPALQWLPESLMCLPSS